ncbi:MAG: hypothetical protein ACOYVF_13395 [Candidatus Zixiibacteriota bacterium]
MKCNIEKHLDSFYNIKVMLKNMPRELWDIFLPENVEGLPQLEMNLLAFKIRETDRNRVMVLQKLCGFPLRPNASLRETQAKARLQGLRKKKLLERLEKDDQDPNTHA